ncbi:MAG: Crp/Fnr family transcriptional regulator [Alphaproteobacteria bacterium HGW-Alphaproteobacteria-5]|nr:MAG: Crp/Fnr family transcriptional regulator [Alphaproteobacteria bacterium HGW-Alphaproteobacteria-5]
MDQHLDLDILARTELFRGAPEAVLRETQAVSFRKRIHAGDVLYRQGDPITSIYVVIVGRLCVTQTTPDGQRVIIRYLNPSEMAGYAAITGTESYPGTATAIDDVHLIGWTPEAFRKLMTDHSLIAMNALAVLGTRYQDIQLRLREIATEKVEQRIAHTVLRLAEQAGRRTSRGIEITLPLSRQDIAEMTGTNLHSVSRAMSAWENEGIVLSGRRRVTVCKLHALAQLAEHTS